MLIKVTVIAAANTVAMKTVTYVTTVAHHNNDDKQNFTRAQVKSIMTVLESFQIRETASVLSPFTYHQ